LLYSTPLNTSFEALYSPLPSNLSKNIVDINETFMLIISASSNTFSAACR